ncbi:hypothetical protein HanXRQr2_Chr05g0206301 [Helianthus annuus]|uniref:Uncharacterized protein n=1 Tax=Helianthus annuus TaxID=4232 RepID=A0A9K3IY41_HELAN|nr:hypothetical protein HanXRQr2_Chr05g0206301 [Helianthus annuus]KAJ0922070.1 hypothetical protein HanPSC8_Chr05g0199221 [Helianthus annuus]
MIKKFQFFSKKISIFQSCFIELTHKLISTLFACIPEKISVNSCYIIFCYCTP